MGCLKSSFKVFYFILSAAISARACQSGITLREEAVCISWEIQIFLGMVNSLFFVFPLAADDQRCYKASGQRQNGRRGYQEPPVVSEDRFWAFGGRIRRFVLYTRRMFHSAFE